MEFCVLKVKKPNIFVLNVKYCASKKFLYNGLIINTDSDECVCSEITIKACIHF